MEDTQARDHVTRCRMAFDREGVILAIEVDTIAAIGAYVSAFGAAIPGYFYRALLAGMYRTPAIHARVRGVYTNTVPVDAYRGAGRPEATYVVERLVERAHESWGSMSRRYDGATSYAQATISLSRPSACATTRETEGLLHKLDEAVDYAALRAEQRRLRAGTLMGVGLAGFIDSSGPAEPARRAARADGGWDNAVVRVHPTGKITVFCGGHSHGQGHATTFAQIVADRMALRRSRTF